MNILMEKIMKKEKTIEITALQQASEKLLKAGQEIDELTVQLASGRAEAEDKFEEIKREFSLQVTQLKDLLTKTSDKDINPEVKAKIESLERQLTAGKADSKELFEEQKKKIVIALSGLEASIKAQWKRIQTPRVFAHEVEKFRLKLEILRLRFGLKKFEIKEDYHTRMSLARVEINKLTSGAQVHLIKGKEKYGDFKDEVSLAYKHLRKAVESLS